MLLKPNDKLLFIGDSITDAGATRSDCDEMGQGYVRYIKDYLCFKYPEMNINVVNKGISGNRSIDLINRWENDIINQKPDFLSICIGTNDIWRQYDSDLDIITPDIYEENLKNMLVWTKEKLNIPVILIEIQPIEDNQPSDRECKSALYKDGGALVKKYNDKVYKVAAEFDTYICPINKILTDNKKKNPSIYYTRDGVHPNSTGITAIGLSWINTLGL